jgi:hypothetical protein
LTRSDNTFSSKEHGIRRKKENINKRWVGTNVILTHVSSKLWIIMNSYKYKSRKRMKVIVRLLIRHIIPGELFLDQLLTLLLIIIVVIILIS